MHSFGQQIPGSGQRTLPQASAQAGQGAVPLQRDNWVLSGKLQPPSHWANSAVVAHAPFRHTPGWFWQQMGGVLGTGWQLPFWHVTHSLPQVAPCARHDPEVWQQSPVAQQIASAVPALQHCWLLSLAQQAVVAASAPRQQLWPAPQQVVKPSPAQQVWPAAQQVLVCGCSPQTCALGQQVGSPLPSLEQICPAGQQIVSPPLPQTAAFGQQTSSTQVCPLVQVNVQTPLWQASQGSQASQVAPKTPHWSGVCWPTGTQLAPAQQPEHSSTSHVHVPFWHRWPSPQTMQRSPLLPHWSFDS